MRYRVEQLGELANEVQLHAIRVEHQIAHARHRAEIRFGEHPFEVNLDSAHLATAQR
ncbi:hypothetical protein [Leucobacter chromiireducens]|uniref:hypothetical protein n=1 Tax=Leucobacter chromiireducens TaxID=283877 RepID=UPI003F7ED22E